MSECTHDCGSCSANCSERKQESLVAQPHKDSHIKKVIGVVSGKGGVGKSMVTSMSAVLMNRRGYRSAVLDADITGPSIPQAFGLHEKAQGNETEIFPVTTRNNSLKRNGMNCARSLNGKPSRGPWPAWIITKSTKSTSSTPPSKGCIGHWHN